MRPLSCSTGQGGGSFAQHLSNTLGVPVRAPNDVLWATPTGRMYVSGMITRTDPFTGTVVREPVLPPTGTFGDFTPGQR